MSSVTSKEKGLEGTGDSKGVNGHEDITNTTDEKTESHEIGSFAYDSTKGKEKEDTEAEEPSDKEVTITSKKRIRTALAV